MIFLLGSLLLALLVVNRLRPQITDLKGVRPMFFLAGSRSSKWAGRRWVRGWSKAVIGILAGRETDRNGWCQRLSGSERKLR
jgi:hypothetical protein